VSAPRAADGALAERIKGLAGAFGFDLAGIAEAAPTPESRRLRDWLARGYAGAMDYLAERVDERVDPRLVLPGARSVVVVALSYAGPGPLDETEGPVARYARGDDYHEVLGERLRALAQALPVLAGRPVRSRAYVDTGPVHERVCAAYAGLGWLGKNTLLIHEELGSFLFLGVVLTDLELPADERRPDRCGSCTACLDACPTGAFPEPGVLDATRCLAYSTIEDPGPIPEPLRAGQGERVFGCDVCQDVCPWNRRRDRRVTPDVLGLRQRLAPRSAWTRPVLAELLALDESRWRALTRRSALRRARYRGLLRNALVAAGNSGDPSLAPALERHAAGPDPLLAEHARWALARLGAA